MFCCPFASVGMFLLISYLRKVGAPFPPLESSISLFLLVIALFFIVIFVIVAEIIIFVEVSKWFVRSKWLKPYVPYLRPEFPPKWPGFATPLVIYKRLAPLLCDYISLYAPFLLIALLGIFVEYRTTSPHTMHLWTVIPKIYVKLYHATNLYVASLFPSFSSNQTHLALILIYCSLLGTLLAALARRSVTFAFYSMIGSFISFVWLMFSLGILGVFTSFERNSLWVFVGSVSFLLVCHLLANTSAQNTWVNVALMSMFMFYLSSFWLGPSVMGAMTLRGLGVGGGIPATFHLKGAVAFNRHIKGREFQGCLILLTSSQVVLRELHHPEGRLTCSLGSLWHQVTPRTTFSHADIYLRSDVTRISSFDESLSSARGKHLPRTGHDTP